MTFFYDLFKRLDAVENRAEPTQLTERDMGKHNNATTGFKAVADKAAKEYGSKAAGERVAGAQFQKMKKAGQLEEESMARYIVTYTDNKKPGQKRTTEVKATSVADAKRAFADWNDSNRFTFVSAKSKIDESGMEEGSRVMHFKAQQAKADGQDSFKLGNEEFPVQEEGGMPMTAKQKSFAALAEPRDKVTFADKIAGAKKEVDEMLGDVAAEAMKAALGGHGEPVEENWDDMLNDVKRRAGMAKKGDTQHGAKHDIKHTSTGRMVTRRVDPEGMSVGADGDAASSSGPRGRGRPKGTGKSTGAKGPSGNSKLLNPEEIEEAIAALEECGYTVTPLEEKAVSKKQQKFMGMVHAAQKGEKPASKEVAKVAKTMKKKDAEDFASTKHEGLPEKKKSEGKKKSKDVEESGTTAGSVATSSEASDSKPEGKKKSGGSSVVGKGIYDSLNRELESMISESMNINVSMSTDPHGGPQKSVTVTATDDDAAELAMMLSRAGVNMGADTGAHACAACGQAPCGCAEVVDENAADWPTQPEYQDTEYMTQDLAGGLNRPKTTGQTTAPVINRDPARQHTPTLESAEHEDDECPVHGYYALPNQEDESGCTCDSGDQVDEVGLSRLSELAGLGRGMMEDTPSPESGSGIQAKYLGGEQFQVLVNGETYQLTARALEGKLQPWVKDATDAVDSKGMMTPDKMHMWYYVLASWKIVNVNTRKKPNRSTETAIVNYIDQNHEDDLKQVAQYQQDWGDDVSEGMNKGQVMAEDLQADDGDHYRSFDDFIGKFDADSFDDVEEHSAGREIRGYINGRCVMSWEFDDESMTSGWGNYDMTMLETVGIMGRTSLYKDMMRYPKGHSPEGQAHRDATAKMAKQVRAAGKEIRRGGTTNVSEPNQWGHADQAVMKYNRSELDEADMDEADQLQRRIGTNIVNKHPRDGQTDLRNIPAGNHPGSKYKFPDEYRSSHADRLKHSIRASLGKHAEPNLPESMASMLNRLDELAEADMEEGATMPKTDPAANLDVLDPKAVVNRGWGGNTKEKIKTRLGQNVYGDLNVAAGEPRSRYYADKPNLPEQAMGESVESHAGRLFRELQQFKG